MTRTHTEMMAYALEIDEKLLPYAAELLADFDELGSDAEDIVDALDALDLPDSTRVLDLGCGKGPVSVEIADELGWRVHGIDLYERFIESARNTASEAEVGELCTFEAGDVIAFSRQFEDVSAVATDRYDVVVMAALGDVLGSWVETMAILRRCVVPGGIILISDCYLRDGGSTDYPGFENYLERAEMIAQLESHGDRLIRAVTDDDDDQVDGERGADAARGEAGEAGQAGQAGEESEHDPDTELIRSRAEALAEVHPELSSDLQSFVDSQGAECTYLAENMTDVLWVLQRGPN